MNSVALYTLGCKLNFAETSAIGQKFIEKGFDVHDFNDAADVYVINTCTVTDNADKECRQIVRRALRKNPNAFVAVIGCYAQLRPEEISKIEGVDLILGSIEKFDILNYVGSLAKNDTAMIFADQLEKDTESFGLAYSTEADSRTRAFFKIQDGCDYPCTYCTIPMARGGSRSLKPDEAVSQFKDLVKQGYKEIILTGVNTGDYGRYIGTSLYELLNRFLETEGEYRIRISSIEPNLLTDEIIELTKKHPKMCNHFHIPLQSGSPKILKLMKRRYSGEYYYKLIHKVHELIPNVGIGVDVIVGFPGETDDDFQHTYDFLKALPISYLHVFTYSERPDTPANKMPDTVPVHIRKKRNAMLRVLSAKKRYDFYKSQQGKELSVLFEHQNKNGKIRGFSENYVRVETPFSDDFANTIIPITISNVEADICKGYP